jgi:hypothetical protein
MQFNKDLVSLYDYINLSTNVDRDNDYLELTMAVGTEKGGKKYKPFKKPLSEMNRQKEDSAIWKLTSESEIGIHYQIYVDKTATSKVRNGKAVTIKPDITLIMEKVKMTDECKSQSQTNILRVNDDNELSRQSSESGEAIRNLVKMFENKLITISQDSSRKNSRNEDYTTQPNNTVTTPYDSKLRGSHNSTIDTYVAKKINPNFVRVDDLIKKEIDNNMNKLTHNKTKLDNIRASRTVLDSEVCTVNDKENIPSFCKAFFIAGVPFQNAKKLSDSEEKLSPCRHMDCSILPAYKSEILYRYPMNDTSSLELNSLVLICLNRLLVCVTPLVLNSATLLMVI